MVDMFRSEKFLGDAFVLDGDWSMDWSIVKGNHPKMAQHFRLVDDLFQLLLSVLSQLDD